MKIWQFIKDKLEQGQSVILLYVLDSQGSSPGRQGFKMAIAKDSEIKGTIGGGIMEHKLVEHSKVRLQNEETEILLKPQFHDKEHPKNQSGMICSGNQCVASIPLSPDDEKPIQDILSTFKNQDNAFIHIASTGWILLHNASLPKGQIKLFDYKNEEDWAYTEKIIQAPIIHIFGGGHVGLALSEVMSLLGFFIKIYDDRSELNTIEQNRFANEKRFVDYEKIDPLFSANETDYVAIMTFGYRTDKVILKQLINQKFAYLGMMGSEKKIGQLLKELAEEGISTEKLDTVKTPIGINIFSKTTMEIAISVAAEIIREKNQHLPTGRTNTKKNMKKDDRYFINMAIALAEEGMNSGTGGPFGCIIVKGDEIVGRGSNQVTSTNDPTAHAEVSAIRAACQNLNDFQLTGCTVYTSCEPCPMCLGAIYWSRADRIVYACTRQDAAAIGFDDDFLYKEVVLPLEQRSIPTVQKGRKAGLKVFQAWEEKEDKVEY